MKFLFLFTTLSFFLSGCDSTVPVNEGSENNIESFSDSQNTESDEYYLQIAKDLFVAQQYTQAYQIATHLAEKNNVEAQYLLGYMLYYGHGAPADIEQGTKWINVSADTGYRPAIEALVLIKHGLTPDNKCSSVNLLPEAKITDDELSKKSELNLKGDEILITPQGIQSKTNMAFDYVQSDKIWNRYTIQLVITESKQYAENYVQKLKNKYPDLSDYIITYQSKNHVQQKVRQYGVGFSTFEKIEDAQIVLEKIKKRLNNPKMWIRKLEEFEPL